MNSIYLYFHHRTLSALPHDCLSTLEPGTRSWISTRFMARGDETPRADQGVLLGREAGVRALLGRVRGALSSRSSLETQGVSSSGAGPSQNGTCLGGGICSMMRAREKYRNSSSVREDQSRYTPGSLHRVK